MGVAGISTPVLHEALSLLARYAMDVVAEATGKITCLALSVGTEATNNVQL
jgi:hypothetical protein